jgi:hypothetical protein
MSACAWRRRRDLNPRDPFEPNGFQDRRFQPLTHSSGFNSNVFCELAFVLLHPGLELLHCRAVNRYTVRKVNETAAKISG